MATVETDFNVEEEGPGGLPAAGGRPSVTDLEAVATIGYRLALRDLQHGRPMPADMTHLEVVERVAGRL